METLLVKRETEEWSTTRIDHLTQTIKYTSPFPNSDYICYVDDVTQIITHLSKFQNIMAFHTQKTPLPINRSELV